MPLTRDVVKIEPMANEFVDVNFRLWQFISCGALVSISPNPVTRVTIYDDLRENIEWLNDAHEWMKKKRYYTELFIINVYFVRICANLEIFSYLIICICYLVINREKYFRVHVAIYWRIIIVEKMTTL